MRFVDLFAGLGGFHYALRALGHECVYASELDPELRELYSLNFPEMGSAVYGDIREFAHKVPRHDILCAGFPCQPFSKSGSQLGLLDQTRGTLFHEILAILKRHQPRYVLLENVGNFERHDSGNTWRLVERGLTSLGYAVRGTTHVTSGGHGLISPHHLGFPQHRERFFIVASLRKLPEDPFPKADRTRATDISKIVMHRSELTPADRLETALTTSQVRCVKHWNAFLATVPREVELPSFPLWGDEISARYPYRDLTPFSAPLKSLRRRVPHGAFSPRPSRQQLLSLLPAYARTEQRRFPSWKAMFIENNREFFKSIRHHLSDEWLADLSSFPPSLRKLEWNCNGEVRDLWRCVLQFRPSGLRAKRYTSSPALVSMTTTQIPILGPERRFLTRTEGLRLQGLPHSHRLPKTRARAFAALGNAVHAGVASAIASRLLTGRPHAAEENFDAWRTALLDLVGGRT